MAIAVHPLSADEKRLVVALAEALADEPLRHDTRVVAAEPK
jgi:hypothetical protein